MDNFNRDAVLAEVLEVVATIFKFDPTQFAGHEALSLANAGIDSLALVEAVFVIEERFDISIPFNANDQSQAAAATLQSVGELVNRVVDLVMEKRAGEPQLASA